MDIPLAFVPRAPGGVIAVTSPECSARDAVLVQLATGVAINNTTTWPASNRAFYIPFEIALPVVVKQVAWVNGTNTTGNMDCGIYDTTLTKLVSTGSTARVGTNATQVVDITDTALDPGNYYMAIANASGSANVFAASPQLASLRLSGVAMEDTAFALPANATFAAMVSSFLPWFGLLLNATA